MDVKREIKRIRHQMKQDYQDVMQALGTHRDATSRAFEELIEQVRTGFAKVSVAMLEQEAAIRAHVQRTDQRFDQMLTVLDDHEERIQKLEDKPPAA